MATYYLAHHGVKGMKWGVRKKQKLQKRLDRTTVQQNKYDKSILDERAKNRTKLEYKYNKKIAKAEKKNNTDKVEDLNLRKKNSLENYDAYTKSVKTGLKIGNENRTKILELKIKAVDNPEIKKSKEYKQAKKWASAQIQSEIFYGRTYTQAMEIHYAHVSKGRSWTRGIYE